MFYGNRVKELRKKNGYTQKQFAEKIGKTTSAVSRLEKQKSSPIKSDTLELLSNALDTSSDYLLGLSDSPKLELVEIVENDDKGVLIPVYGKVAAGVPIEALPVDNGWIPIEKAMIKGGKRFIGLKVKGDSMYPFYMEDDTVIIEITPEVNENDDVVAYIGYDYEATLKRFHWDEDGISLEPLNREYPIKHYGRGDAEVRILGKVVEVRRKM